MTRLLDLQLMIGLFFICLSALLLTFAAVAGGNISTASGLDADKVNLAVGGVFLVFGSAMLGASLMRKKV